MNDNMEENLYPFISQLSIFMKSDYWNAFWETFLQDISFLI